MIGKRLLHLLKTSWLMWRLRRAKTDTTKKAAQHALAAQLAGGRGLPMKIGQVLAGMHDDTAYQSLTQSVEPWKLNEMLPILEQAWGKDIVQILSSIDESKAAASLGQVHHARLLDGTEVAIKLQYPDIAKAIESEMTIAGLMPRGGPVKRWDFNLDAYKATLKDNMAFELDYLHEMRQQQQFRDSIHVNGLEIPAIHEDLCRTNILTQTWVTGFRLSEAATWGKLHRLQIAKILMQTMFQSIFETGLVHGDPHPGNIMFHQNNEQAKVTLLDFGCMLEILETRRLALLQLILACRGECTLSPLQGFAAIGFDAEKLALIEPDLPKLTQILFRPFIEERPFDLSAWHPGQETEALLGNNRWIFRASGPADLFLLMRVFQGLVQQLKTLDTQLPWYPILQQSISNQTIQQAKEISYTANDVDPKIHSSSIHGSAKLLHIRVNEGDCEKVHLTLPATNALQLSSIIPDSAIDIIQEQGINLQEIEDNLITKGLKPQQLLEVRDKNKCYTLWLD